MNLDWFVCRQKNICYSIQGIVRGMQAVSSVKEGSILCAEIIRKNGRICNDLVGYAAARVEEMR